MNAMIVLLGGLAILVIGYVLYGGWLAKQWGVDPSRPTPAQEMHDGVDYVPTKPYILLGHHFSSIAGAGPINGPIQAAVFGWGSRSAVGTDWRYLLRRCARLRRSVRILAP